MCEGTMDTEIKATVRKIFDDLRKQQPRLRSRKSDRVNVDQMLEEFRQNSLKSRKNFSD